VLLAAPIGVFAQSNETTKTFSRAELDQMLHRLRFTLIHCLHKSRGGNIPGTSSGSGPMVKENNSLSKDQLKYGFWINGSDLSVKALAPFPQVLVIWMNIWIGQVNWASLSWLSKPRPWTPFSNCGQKLTPRVISNDRTAERGCCG